MKRILYAAVLLLLIGLGWKTQEIYAQSPKKVTAALVTKANVKVDIPRAMRQAKQLMDWLTAHPSERRQNDPQPPRELLTLPEQQLMGWSEKQKDVSFYVLCPHLNFDRRDILFVCGTFVHSNPKVKDGLSEAIPGAGFYIVGYGDGPFKGQIKQVPVEQTRRIGCADLPGAECVTYPGASDYREDLPRDYSIDRSKENQTKLTAQENLAGWGLPSRAARISWWMGADHTIKFNPKRAHNMYPRTTDPATQHP